MTLTYDPFKYTSGITKIIKTGKVVQLADKGEHVNLIKAALVELGYTVPLKAQSGVLDSTFNHQTAKAVIQFQTDQKLTADGKVGKKTILALDKLLTQKFKKAYTPVKTKKPVLVSPITNQDYILGTNDPKLWSDKGAGSFDSEKMEKVMWAKKYSIKSILPPSLVARKYVGPNAAKHMSHYFKTLGTDYKIDLENMIKSSKEGKDNLMEEAEKAKQFIETLPPGKHNIVAKTFTRGANREQSTKDWYFAVGEYSFWGKGIATVSKDRKSFQLEFEYHVYDRYNWDSEPGLEKAVVIAGEIITDKFMGTFHRQGLAKEFNMKGMVKRSFRWKAGDVIPSIQYNAMPTGRLIYAH